MSSNLKSADLSISSTNEANWVNKQSGNLDEFIKQVSVETNINDWPNASAVEQNVLVYNGDDIRAAATNQQKRAELLREWASALLDGPGIVAFKNAIADNNVIDETNQLFADIMRSQRETGHGQGDHFAKPGANDRIWNALEKHCIANPDSFARYYSNDCIAMISQAWLGRGYQVTAQVNQVNPGGQAQLAHRDYHLGFMSQDQALEYPAHVHLMCPTLTLQGAVAHCDMPLESGPTLYLPYSHKHKQGYIVFGQDDYQDYFNNNRKQLALEKSDMVFFNPALMHAAGHNQSKDIHRLANLLQVSSAFGRSIEAVNRSKMLTQLYPTLLQLNSDNNVSKHHLNNIIAATAEGYAFPTNLDTDLPVGGLAPPSQADLVRSALAENLDVDDFLIKLQAQQKLKTDT
jgi:ectoine hydroxylase-related dioxygenase (phytanoyl-CoA dioxygenase family)